MRECPYSTKVWKVLGNPLRLLDFPEENLYGLGKSFSNPDTFLVLVEHGYSPIKTPCLFGENLFHIPSQPPAMPQVDLPFRPTLQNLGYRNISIWNKFDVVFPRLELAHSSQFRVDCQTWKEGSFAHCYLSWCSRAPTQRRLSSLSFNSGDTKEKLQRN